MQGVCRHRVCEREEGSPVGVEEVLDLHEGGQHVCVRLLGRHV